MAHLLNSSLDIVMATPWNMTRIVRLTHGNHPWEREQTMGMNESMGASGEDGEEQGMKWSCKKERRGCERPCKGND